MPDPSRSFPIPQNQEKNAKTYPIQHGCLRYAYARSADTQKNNDIGQDYLTFLTTPERLTFVICDGVSQSFFGDLAARILGNHLLGWMAGLEGPLSQTGEAYDALKNYLKALTEPATAEVMQLRLPEKMPGMIVAVLEKKRQMGSETTFVAGTLDFKAGWFSLVWMGDTRLRLWNADGEQTHALGNVFLTRERWSTHKGMVGEPHVFGGGLRDLKHLLAYSDGFAKLDRVVQRVSPSDEAINRLMEEAVLQPNSDDISLFEWWSGQPAFDRAPGSSKEIQCKEKENKLDVSWKPADGATRYEASLWNQAGETVASAIVEGTQCSFSDEVYQKGAKQACVRAFHNDEPGEWACKGFTNRYLLWLESQSPVEAPVKQPPGLPVAGPPPGQDTASKPPASEPGRSRLGRPSSGPAAPPPAPPGMGGWSAVDNSVTTGPPIGEECQPPRRNTFPFLAFGGLLVLLIAVLFVFLKLVLLPPPDRLAIAGEGGETPLPAQIEAMATPTKLRTHTSPPTVTSLPSATATPMKILAGADTETMTETPAPTETASQVAITATVETTPLEARAPTAAPPTWSSLSLITFDQFSELQSLPVAFPPPEGHPAQAPVLDDVLLSNWQEGQQNGKMAAVALFTNSSLTPASNFAVVYENETGELNQWTLKQLLPDVRAVAMSGKTIVSVQRIIPGNEPVETLQIWNRQDGNWVKGGVVPYQGSTVCALAFEGENLLALDRNGKLVRISLQMGKLQEFELGLESLSPEWRCSLTVVQDRSAPEPAVQLAASLGNGYWFGSLRSDNLLPLSALLHLQPLQALALSSPDWLLMKVGELFWNDSALDALGANVLMPDRLPNELKPAAVNRLHFSDDGKLLVSVSQQGAVFWYAPPQE